MRDEGHAAAQVRQGVRSDGFAVHEQGAVGWGAEGRHQAGEGGFSSARSADEGHRFACVELQVNAVEHPHVLAVGVVKADLLEADGQAVRGRRGRRTVQVEVHGFAVAFDQVHHFFDGAESALEFAENVGDAPDAARHESRHQQEAEELL